MSVKCCFKNCKKIVKYEKIYCNDHIWASDIIFNFWRFASEKSKKRFESAFDLKQKLYGNIRRSVSLDKITITQRIKRRILLDSSCGAKFPPVLITLPIKDEIKENNIEEFKLFQDL